MNAARGSLLGIEHLDRKTILDYLQLARRMNPKRITTTLRGKRVGLLFYEASTRTRVSFELAAKALSATTFIVTSSASSIEKGESLIDNAYTLRALGADAIVIRHPSSGGPNLMARHIDIPVINAGDGMHEHPSQALLDAFTILQHRKSFDGLNVTLVADVYHSRVARSDIFLMTKLGAQVTLCGPPELVPDIAPTIAPNVRVVRTLDEALPLADIIIVLRIQRERLEGLQLSMDDYIANYQVTPERLKMAKPNVVLMHPGPIIRGNELVSAVADAPQSLILEQVSNGVPVRMAILLRALGKA